MDRGDGRIYRKHGNSCHLLLYCKYLKIQCVHNIPYINSLVFMSINIHRCCKYSFDEYTYIYSWRITFPTYIVILIYCLYFIVDPIHSETRYSEGHNWKMFKLHAVYLEKLQKSLIIIININTQHKKKICVRSVKCYSWRCFSRYRLFWRPFLWVP